MWDGRFVFMVFSSKFVYFARSVHRILTHGKPFTLCLSYRFPKIAFSSSFRMTTYFGLSVKNVSVQVTRTLTIFVEHDPYNRINGSANQTSRIAMFSDLAFNIYGTCHPGCYTHHDCIAFSS